MAQKVLILGDSGTGKSASLRNFKEDEVFVINTAGKPLPFKNHFETFTPSFNRLTQDVLKAMDSTSKKVIVIDDAQYIMSFQYMRRIKENGWDKWNDIQGDFFKIVKEECDKLPDDVIVYFLSHLQRDDEGHEKIKTMGKMLDEKITIEGLFTIVLKTIVKDGQYFFATQNSGLDTVKSPIGMFPSYAIDNDLKYVDTKIRNYYEIGEFVNDEEVAQMDQKVEKAEIVKPDADGRRRRKADPEAKKDVEAKGTGNVDGQGDVSAPVQQTESSTAEQPKSRRRKERIVEDDESVKEAEKVAETGAQTVTVAAEDVGAEKVDVAVYAIPQTPAAEEPKPKRRRKTAEERQAQALASFHEITDDDIPF